MRYDYTYFRDIIQPKRWNAVIKYLNSIKGNLMQWAVETGMISSIPPEPITKKERDHYNVILMECNSRLLGMIVICQHYGYNPKNIEWTELSCNYDAKGPDGKRFEFKYRMNDTDQYNTDRIDEEKKLWTCSTTEEGVILIYMTFEGNTYAYNLDKPDKTSPWDKYNNSTAHYGCNGNTKIVTKTSMEFFRSSSLWSGTTATISYMYDQQRDS